MAHEQQGESRAEYGKEVLKRLAEKLTVEFGRGFSKSNLEYMRRFFLAYQDRMPIAQSATGQFLTAVRDPSEIAQTATGQLLTPAAKLHAFRLSWTHYVSLLGISNGHSRRAARDGQRPNSPGVVGDVDRPRSSADRAERVRPTSGNAR